MDNLEVTWKRTFIVWWSFTWRSTLLGIIAGGIAGFFGCSTLALMGKAELSGIYLLAIKIILPIAISMWAIKKILSMKFEDFSILLVPTCDIEDMEQNVEQ